VILAYPLLIVAIRPYRGWDVRHDMFYFGLAACAVFGYFWVYGAEAAVLFSAD